MKSFLKHVKTRLSPPRADSGETGTYRFAQGLLPVNRISLVNHLVVSHGLTSYLEIGCRDKSAMNDLILAPRRASIDPDPNAEAEFEMTSDEYFRDHDETFDIIFVDGLHTGDQVRADITNSLNALNPGGFVLLHDMNPPSAFHARENYEVDGTFPTWNGTSWEGYAWHRKHTPDIEMCVVDADWGVGVICRGEQTPWTGPTEGYDTLAANRRELLNLISVRTFLERFRAHAAA